MINSNITIDNSSASKVNAIVELYMGSTVVTCTCNDRLQDLVIERAGVDGKFFGFGITQKLSVNLIDLERTLTVEKGTSCLIAFGVDNTFEYPYPPFYVSEISRDENTNTISLVAYDKLYEAEAHEVSELGLSSYTIREFAEACATTLGLSGVVVEGDTDGSFALGWPEGANFDGTEKIRSALNAIAEVTQTIYFVNREEKLVFKRLNNDSERVLTVRKQDYATLKSEEGRKLTGIVSATELGDNVSAGLRAYKSGNGIISVSDVSNESYEVDIRTAATTGTIRSYGKNLISYPYTETTKTSYGITFTDNGNGSITINGTSGEVYITYTLFNYLPLENGVTYRIVGADRRLHIKYYDENGATKYATDVIVWDSRYTFDKVYLQIQDAGETFNNVTYYPMVCKASLDAEFEPYIGREYAVNADGTVTGVSALSPYMTLSIADNAVIGMDYYRQREEGATQYVRDNPFWELREDIRDLVDTALIFSYGLTITPFECSWDGNFLLEPADKVGFVAENDTIIDTYILNDTIIFDGTLSENTHWIYTENEGETLDNPTSLGEALKQTFARVDKVNKEITLMVSDIQTTKNDLSSFENDTNEKLDNLTETTLELSTTLKQTAEDVTIKVESIEKTINEDGVSKVKTVANQYTFDDEGLKISKTDAQTNTTITEEGMTVSNSDGEPLLQAMVNNEVQGVRAKDLHATTYLIVGTNSRFEDFGTGRTGCFWIGN